MLAIIIVVLTYTNNFLSFLHSVCKQLITTTCKYTILIVSKDFSQTNLTKVQKMIFFLNIYS